MSSSEYLGIVDKILLGLTQTRMENNAWLDNTSPEKIGDPEVFKIGECLRPFYQAAKVMPEKYNPPDLRSDLLKADTERFFELVGREGYVPKPYSSVKTSTDQYIDFAAFVLEFCTLTYDYWKANSRSSTRRNRHNLVETSRREARKAYDFLMNPEHSYVDSDGRRWAGTTKFEDPAKQYYTDTFFTALVVVSLQRTLDCEALNLSEDDKQRTRAAIRQAGQWIISRFNGKAIMGDEYKERDRLLYTTWGLRALLESWATQDEEVRRTLPDITAAYLKALRAKLEGKDFFLKQEHLTIYSAEGKIAALYNDRTDVAAVLLTLTQLRADPPASEIRSILDELNYRELFNKIYRKIMGLRDDSSGLWHHYALNFTINSCLVEAFLLLEKYKDGFESPLAVYGYQVREAVRKALENRTLIGEIKEGVYAELLKLIEEKRKQEKFKAASGFLRVPPSE